MALKGCIKFIKNIRTRAVLVGAVLTLEAIAFLLLFVSFYVLDLQNEYHNVEYLMVYLVMGTVIIFGLIVSWVGFRKRQRWYVKAGIICFLLNKAIYLFAFLVTIDQLKMYMVVVLLILLAVKALQVW